MDIFRIGECSHFELIKAFNSPEENIKELLSDFNLQTQEPLIQLRFEARYIFKVIESHLTKRKILFKDLSATTPTDANLVLNRHVSTCRNFWLLLALTIS